MLEQDIGKFSVKRYMQYIERTTPISFWRSDSGKKLLVKATLLFFAFVFCIALAITLIIVFGMDFKFKVYSTNN